MYKNLLYNQPSSFGLFLPPAALPPRDRLKEDLILLIPLLKAPGWCSWSFQTEYAEHDCFSTSRALMTPSRMVSMNTSSFFSRMASLADLGRKGNEPDTHSETRLPLAEHLNNGHIM
jgi:hypothetical protein